MLRPGPVDVATPYGVGTLRRRRNHDDVIEIVLPYGVAYLPSQAWSPPLPAAVVIPVVSTADTFCLPIADLTATVPASQVDDAIARVIAHDDVVAAVQQPTDGTGSSLNFVDGLPRLRVLHTAGSGDCLLNAASLAMWGVQDHTARDDVRR